jgi:hypothetical protein
MNALLESEDFFLLSLASWELAAINRYSYLLNTLMERFQVVLCGNYIYKNKHLCFLDFYNIR